MKKKRGKIIFFIIILCSIVIGFLFKSYIKDTQNIYNSSLKQFYNIVVKVKEDRMKEIIRGTINEIDLEREKVLQQCELLFINIKNIVDNVLNEGNTVEVYKKIDEALEELYPDLLVKMIVINTDNNEIIGSNDDELLEGRIIANNYFSDYKRKLKYSMEDHFIEGNMSLLIGIKEEDIENSIKNISINKIREAELLDGGYIWVNEIIDFNGGDNYARRLVHPNLKNTEGEMLSTNFADINGNLPYKEELDGINNSGDALIEYHFKKNNSTEISKKMSYIQLYPKYNWAIGTGVYLDDLETYIYENGIEFRVQLKRQIYVTIFTTILLFIIAGVMGILIFDYYELKKSLLIRKENQIIKRHYSLMENKYDTANEIIHDIKNHLLCIQGLAVNDQSYRVLDYTNSINCDISQLGYMVITGNKIIDIILDEKIYLMKSNNIEFKQVVENINLDFIEYKDAVTILTNILD
ncbi:MAG: cache domain-containing protein, partial [Clostridium sp.]